MNSTQSFNRERKRNIEKMRRDVVLRSFARRFYSGFSRYNYQYNFDWLGRPIIQIPQDMVAMQEIIWKTKPDLIIETGIARGGSLIFYASLLELIGKGKVLGVDVDIRMHNRKEIKKHKMSKRIQMIEGSSTDGKVVKKVAAVAKKHKKIMVCLDSLHTHAHVLEELHIYSQFVSKGNYLVVFDTVIEHLPKSFFKDKPWDKGNNPASAVQEFLKKNKKFVVDAAIDGKLLITCAHGGYLKRID